MFIACPNCAASYEVSASAIGAAGGSVRCVRCRSVWHQQAEAEAAPQALTPAPGGDETVAAFQAELGGTPQPPAAAGEPAAPIADTTASAPVVPSPGAAGPSLDDMLVSSTPDAPPAPDGDAAAASEIATGAGGKVYAWTAMPTREVLEPGETLAFRSRLASPPGDGRDVLVRLYTRLDAVAGLR